MTHTGVSDGTKEGFGQIFIFQGANGLDQGAKVVFFNFQGAMAPLAPEDIRPVSPWKEHSPLHRL